VLPQHPDEHRPEDPVLLAVDQQLGEGPGLRVPLECVEEVQAAVVRRNRFALGASYRAMIRPHIVVPLALVLLLATGCQQRTNGSIALTTQPELPPGRSILARLLTKAETAGVVPDTQYVVPDTQYATTPDDVYIAYQVGATVQWMWPGRLTSSATSM
jgi:hypothetical protein